MELFQRFNSITEWSAVHGAVAFLCLALIFLGRMVWTRSQSWVLSLVPIFSTWVILGNLAHLYVFEVASIQARWVPFGIHLFKDLSGMATIVIWSFFCAEKLDGIATVRATWVPRILELSWAAFPPCFLLAVGFGAWATAHAPSLPVNLEMSTFWSSTVYRWFVAGPILIYSAVISYWFIRLFILNREPRHLDLRTRLFLCAATFAATAVWAAAYVAWPFSVPDGTTQIVQQVALTSSLLFAVIYLRPPSRQSRNDRNIRTFEHDQEFYEVTGHMVDGVYEPGYIHRWKTMLSTINSLTRLLEEGSVNPRQLRAAKLALYLSQSPADDVPSPPSVLEQTNGLSKEGKDTISVANHYGISEQHPLWDELEDDLQAHQEAYHAAMLLKEPKVTDKLSREPYWIQILAVAIADGGVMPSETRKAILDDQRSSVHPAILSRYMGLVYQRKQPVK